MVVDGRIEAIVVTESDSLNADKVWAKVKPNTVKAIELLRAPRAQELYSEAKGDVISITRCY
jgi:hypothetical protein